MTTVPADIAAFVAVHFASKSISDARAGVEKIAVPGRDWYFQKDGRTVVAVFARASTAFEFVKRAYGLMGAKLDRFGAKFGIECGEMPREAISPQRLAGVERAIDLAMQAHRGQTLVGPAATAIGQNCLPVGFGLIDQGQIRIGSRIAAEQVAQLKVPGHHIDFPPPESLEDVSSNFDEPSSSPIGREREEREVLQALIARRLVTLTGPAGVGKSCLATWVGAALASTLRDGAWKVDLASVPLGGSIATAVAGALGLTSGTERAMGRVQRALTSMDGLLLLDNCEHLVGECAAFLEQILDECPKVRFILSSRVELGARQEYVIRLDPFEVPDGTDDVEGSEAVRLFLECARKSNRDFVIRPSELAMVATLCRRLGGLPLAIELAAAQLATQSLKQILDRLTARPDRKLEGAIDWSYSLLKEDEQRFFRACGVLVGTTNREIMLGLAAALGAAPGKARALLQKLSSASLLQATGPAHAPRYRLLEPLKEFSITKLEEEDELKATQLTFARECLRWVREWKEQATSARQRDHHLRRESANLNASVKYLLAHPEAQDEALRLCLELKDFWLMNGPYDQASLWFEDAISKSNDAQEAALARAYNTYGLLAGYAGEYGRSKRALQKAIELARETGDAYYQAAATSNLALTCRNDGQIDRAIAYARKALEITPADAKDLRMMCLGNVASYLALGGHPEEAHSYVCQAMELNEELHDKWSSAGHHATLAQIHELEFRLPRARQECRISISLYWEAGDVQGLLCAMEREARLRLFTREFERAAVLIGGTMRHFDRRGVGRPMQDVMHRDNAVQQIKEHFGEERAEALMSFGAQKNLQELHYLALENSSPD